MEINLIFHYSTETGVTHYKEKINFPCRLNYRDEINVSDIITPKFDFPSVMLWTVKSCWFSKEGESVMESVLLIASQNEK